MITKLIKTATISGLLISSLFLNSCDSSSNNAAIPSGPTNVTITFTATGSTGFAPVFFATHSGDFDFFDTGSVSSDALETMAELGSPADILAQLQASDNSVTTGGVTAPGNSVTVSLTIDEANRYFTYGGMVLPSSDTFVGNNNPTQFNILQMLANSNSGSVTINIDRLYDAGTEVNDFATSPGGPLVGLPDGQAELSVDENEFITLSDSDFFNDYLNAGNFDVSTINPNGNVIGTITITRTP